MTLLLTVATLLAVAIVTALIDRWARARRRRCSRLPETGDDTRQVDILKRGQVCPWPKDG